ncbi:MAG: hypothetical protein ACTTHG_07800 [Treponemataceae bacterium]
MYCFNRKLKNFVIFVFIPLFFSSTIFAEYFTDTKNGFGINFVDGFKIQQQSENGYYFTSDFIPVEFVLNVYDSKRFECADDAVDFALKKLAVTKFKKEAVQWHNANCCIANFDFVYQDTDCLGWAFSVQLTDTKKVLTILGYTASQNNEVFEQVIISTLDGFFTDRLSLFSPGPITSFVFQKEGTERKTIEFKGIKTDVVFDKSDENASNYVVEREHAVLELLSQTDYWLSSWKRFYQVIYRDSYSRIKSACFAFCNELYSVNCDKENSDEEFTKNILEFTQNLPYGRNENATDFTNLCSTFLGSVSDCDSRCLLSAVLLNMMNIKSTLFVSVEYSHAMFGVALDGEGAKLKAEDTEYLLGETTAKVGLGKIAKNMSDSSKWINIPLLR